MSDFFELIKQRESCRNFDSEKPVGKAKLDKCIEAARVAPSACNSQPWHFTVITSPVLVPKVAECLQEMGMNKFTGEAPAFIVVTEEKANLSSRISSFVKSQEYAQIDIGIAVAHICLAASDQGLASCIIGWFNEEKLKTLLNTEKRKRVRCVICLGYSAADGVRKKIRKPKEEIVSFFD